MTADNSLTSRSLSTYKTLAFSLQFRVIVVFLYNKILKNPMISAACIKLLSRKEFHAHFQEKKDGSGYVWVVLRITPEAWGSSWGEGIRAQLWDNIYVRVMFVLENYIQMQQDPWLYWLLHTNVCRFKFQKKTQRRKLR